MSMSGFLMAAARWALYPVCGRVGRPFGPSPLADQQLAGALMWGGSMLIDSIWVLLAVSDWLRSEARLAARIDLQTMADLPASAGAGAPT